MRPPSLWLFALLLAGILLVPGPAHAQFMLDEPAEEGDAEEGDESEEEEPAAEEEEPAQKPARRPAHVRALDDLAEGDEPEEKQPAKDEAPEEEPEKASRPATPQAAFDIILPPPGKPFRELPEVEIPPAEEFYPADEPQREEKLQAERLMGLYLLHPPWRHEAERVEIQRKELRLSYWYSVSADADAVACDALRWLAGGRNQWSGGAEDLFDEMEGVDRLVLAFINVEKRQKGRVPGLKDNYRYLQATITRDHVLNLSPGNVEDVLASGTCMPFMQKNLDEFRFDTVYYQKQLLRGLEAR